MSACTVGTDKPETDGDSGDGGTTNPEVDPDTNPTAKRFIENLRNLGSLYGNEFSEAHLISVQADGSITYGNNIAPFYLEEILNDTQALYSQTNNWTAGKLKDNPPIHVVLSIEIGSIWSYYPTNTTHSLDLLNLDKANLANQKRHDELATLARDPQYISLIHPGNRYFYKKVESLTDVNTLSMRTSYDVVDVLFGSSTDGYFYKTNATPVKVTVSPDKKTITYTKPQLSPTPSIERVFTFYQMNGVDAIYTTPHPSFPATLQYYAITIKDNLLFMGGRTGSYNPDIEDYEISLIQRNVGHLVF